MSELDHKLVKKGGVLVAIHVVQAGDTLWGIAQRYNVEIEALIENNGLRSSLLMPGLALYIPAPTLTTHFYQIQPGDTLWEIARKFQTSVENIIVANWRFYLYNLQVGKTINVPSVKRMKLVTVGFLVPYSLENFFANFPTYADELTYLAVASYSFLETGELTVDHPDDGIPALCRHYHVIPLAMIRNVLPDGTFSKENVGRMLAEPVARFRLIEQLMKVIQEKGYGGVSIDFEFIPPAQRKDFITFLEELKESLGERTLHVNVHSKTEDSLTNPITGGHDYAAIGKVADIVAVMTMDYGYPGGPPNPVAPIDWMEEVIRYAISQIERKKLQVAFPLYGYDWELDTNKANGLSLLAAQNQAIDERVSIQFDGTAMAPYYEYWQNGNGHLVWFDDIRSYNEKYKLVDFYGLLGVTFWETRLSFPQNWAFMKEHIHVVKKK